MNISFQKLFYAIATAFLLFAILIFAKPILIPIILAFADVTLFLNNHVGFMENLEKGELFNRMKVWLTDSTQFLVSKTVSTTATFMAGMLATIIFTFLFLIYRDGLTKAFLAFSPENKRERVLKMFKSVQQVGQKYLFGMVILTIIIGLA